MKWGPVRKSCLRCYQIIYDSTERINKIYKVTNEVYMNCEAGNIQTNETNTYKPVVLNFIESDVILFAKTIRQLLLARLTITHGPELILFL